MLFFLSLVLYYHLSVQGHTHTFFVVHLIYIRLFHLRLANEFVLKKWIHIDRNIHFIVRHSLSRRLQHFIRDQVVRLGV